jgi:hypothetical protein
MPAKAASSIPERQIGPMSCGVLDHPLSRMMTTVGGEPPILLSTIFTISQMRFAPFV